MSHNFDQLQIAREQNSIHSIALGAGQRGIECLGTGLVTTVNFGAASAGV